LDDLVTRERKYLKRLQALHLRIQLLEEEGLVGPDCARSLNDAIQITAMEGDLDRLQKYSHLAVGMYKRGGNTEAAKEARQWVVDSKAHPAASKKNTANPKEPLAKQDENEMLADLEVSLGFTTEEQRAFREQILEAAKNAIQL